ncbi:hypothetical protein [Arenibaculum pallidiluteum]|uniref:hypothetical protein n=1 Tax=Arenibaculum pallidiluteum TaxID=2812559 RepID=UPI001A9588DD|nr:hypothetical protein [Arenibaculum pallidiluteum]
MNKSVVIVTALAAAVLVGCTSKNEPPPSAAAAEPPPAPVKDLLTEPPSSFHVAAFNATPTSCTGESGRHWATVGLQVEMMVTSLNCGAYFGNPNAYAEYRAMAGQNSEVLAGATRAVAASFGKGQDGIRRFDSEQTRVANALALSAGGFNQAAFCEPRREWFERLKKATRAELEAYSAVVAPALCARQQVVLAEAEAARKLAAEAKAKADAEKKVASKAKKAPAGKKQVASSN